MTRTLTLCALTLLAIPILGQSAKPVDVTVTHVNDRRTTGSFAHLTIRLELPKIPATDVGAWRALINSAADDSGRDLVEPAEQEPQFETYHQMGMSQGNAPPEPATISLQLRNPDRNAKKVKEVKGAIELYTPSKDPNSTAEVPKFLSLAGKPLAHKALKANGVEIAIVTPAQIDAEKKRLGDAKRKEAQADGLEGEGLDQYVASYLEYVISLEESDLAARIKDPNKRIYEIAYVDAAGEVKRVSMRNSDTGLTVLSTWGEKAQPDWKLRVSMKTPKNVVRYSFALADVALP
jgi:hypothetical protein